MTKRPELSIKNKYWINKHRHYELKHFCLQYPYWKKTYSNVASIPSSVGNRFKATDVKVDPTANRAIQCAGVSDKIKLIETAVKETDGDLQVYILKAVTEGLSYTHLKSKLDIPCSRDTYYDRYRRFFWILDKIRD